MFENLKKFSNPAMELMARLTNNFKSMPAHGYRAKDRTRRHRGCQHRTYRFVRMLGGLGGRTSVFHCNRCEHVKFVERHQLHTPYTQNKAEIAYFEKKGPCPAHMNSSIGAMPEHLR